MNKKKIQLKRKNKLKIAKNKSKDSKKKKNYEPKSSVLGKESQARENMYKSIFF